MSAESAIDKPQYTQKQVDMIVFAAVVQATGMMNGVPVHTHKCPDGHTWFCPSPYCEDVNAIPRACTDHGGSPVILKGQEPWRGGMRA
jgi:hypothetical protein